MAIFEDPERLDALSRRWKVKKLSLFGSRLKGTQRPDSDIDLLVEFERDGVPGLMGISQLELDLSELAGGAKIDLRTAQDLSRYFREEVVRTARLEHTA
jgi:predicted nucleotidyltransferase